MVRVDGVVAAPALAPLSFDVPAGRCVGVLGSASPDTSRLLLMVAALARPLTGRVHIDGLDSVRDVMRARGRMAITRIQCVDSRIRLGEHLRAVSQARIGTGTPVRVSVAAAIERLALDGSRPLSTLDARAEAALAAALLPTVNNVVLDEPFRLVSADTRARAIDWIRALADESVSVVIGGCEERDLRAVSHNVIRMGVAR